MQFEITMRDGSTYEVDASYIEVVSGPTSSTYTLLGAVPGYPTAILAAFPVELVVGITPASSGRVKAPPAPNSRHDKPNARHETNGTAEPRRSAGPQLVTEDYY